MRHTKPVPARNTTKKRARRDARPSDPATDSGTHILPPDFVRAAQEWLGDEVGAFLAACARPPALAIRANPLKGGLPALLPLLGPDAAAWPRLPWWPEALLPSPDEAAALAAHALARIGALYAQDPAALAAVAALDPQPGERVLDIAAAPGGKSSAIAGRMGGQGLLVANDVEPRRARELAHTLERWGTRNAAVLALAPERLALLAPGFFDRVLVDAPCSGEAMFARRPRAAVDWSSGHVAGCAARQRPLLDTARRLARPGGLLVYATCTFNPTENEGIIAAYLAAHPADTLDDLAARLPGAAPGQPDLLTESAVGPRAAELVRCARLWPQRGPGAGHFVAAIRVSADEPDEHRPMRAPRSPAARLPAGATRRPARSADIRDDGDVAAVHELLAAVVPDLNHSGRVAVRRDRAFLVPSLLPESLADVAMAPGLQVAERRGRTWRPAHALAMALRAHEAAAFINLDDDAALAFLGGRPTPGEGAGLLLAVWHGYSLGWARARAGILTPLLPSGLRLRR